jgi:ABC-type transporter Mla MlaB component
MHERDQEAAEAQICSAVALSGKASLPAALALAASARQALSGAGHVIVQCSALESIDIRVVQILLALKRELAVQARTMHLVGVPDSVASLLAATGLSALSALPRAVGANDVAE